MAYLKMSKENRERLEQLAEHIREFEVAMLTTTGDDGQLYSRPMMNARFDLDGTLWFFSPRQTGKMKAIEKNHKVNVTYADSKNQKFLSLTGSAEVIDDNIKAYDIWQPKYRMWWPKGDNDKDLWLIKVTVHEAEVWDFGGFAAANMDSALKSIKSSEPVRGSHDEVFDVDHLTQEVRSREASSHQSSSSVIQ